VTGPVQARPAARARSGPTDAGTPAIVALIEEKLQVLGPESIAVEDESGQHVGHSGAAAGGGHYRLTIVAREFAGRPRVARHRMVYAALGDLMGSRIHALALCTLAPDEI